MSNFRVHYLIFLKILKGLAVVILMDLAYYVANHPKVIEVTAIGVPDELPKTNVGKILRKDLRNYFFALKNCLKFFESKKILFYFILQIAEKVIMSDSSWVL